MTLIDRLGGALPRAPVTVELDDVQATVLRYRPEPYRYYLCHGRTDPLRAAEGQRCTARYIPADQLDELVWGDLRALLTHPAQMARALSRARGGAWLPQELHARQAAIRQA